MSVSRFANWPPRVEYAPYPTGEPIQEIQAQPAKAAKKKKPKKTSKQRLKGGR